MFQEFANLVQKAFVGLVLVLLVLMECITDRMLEVLIDSSGFGVVVAG